jgi:hypothetical protein
MGICLRRRDLMTLLGGAAAWPLAARAQRRAKPVVDIATLVRPGRSIWCAARSPLLRQCSVASALALKAATSTPGPRAAERVRLAA